MAQLTILRRKCEHDPPDESAIHCSLLVESHDERKPDQSIELTICHRCARALIQRLMANEERRVLQRLLDTVSVDRALSQVNELLGIAEKPK